MSFYKVNPQKKRKAIKASAFIARAGSGTLLLSLSHSFYPDSPARRFLAFLFLGQLFFCQILLA